MVEQRRHGEPWRRLRRGHRLEHADFGPAPAVVVDAIACGEGASYKVKWLHALQGLNEDGSFIVINAEAATKPPPVVHEQQRTRGSDVAGPSSLYGARLWKLGLWAARLIPVSICTVMVRFLANVYWIAAWHRREVLIQNLLPAVNGDRRKATILGRRLMNQFAIKLVDLWRYEAGLPINDLLGTTGGWEHFQKAREQKRGILLLTPHLGNWEFGGPLLSQAGVPLQVITLAEPGKDFTKLRQESRAKWNIETLVIGNDAFAFVEIIRRLEAGATVALLVDRPPDYTATEVELFGRPFRASIAAAELARASGCALLPVYLPRRKHSYAANMLAEIPYDRATLRDRAARQELTQRILKTFEPIIAQDLDQWYHFVPLWTKR
jgi:lauroyl/myristoyl acyltransferase